MIGLLAPPEPAAVLAVDDDVLDAEEAVVAVALTELANAEEMAAVALRPPLLEVVVRLLDVVPLSAAQILAGIW
jgi:hypothetical protein